MKKYVLISFSDEIIPILKTHKRCDEVILGLKTHNLLPEATVNRPVAVGYLVPKDLYDELKK